MSTIPHPKTATVAAADQLAAAKQAHAEGRLVQFRDKQRPWDKWRIYGEPFTWCDLYEYRPAPAVDNTPWRLMPDGPETEANCVECLRIEDADGNYIMRASECAHAHCSPLERAYAEHIVRCVNAHADLLAIAKKGAK